MSEQFLEKQEGQQWCEVFIKKGGFQHVVSIYLNLSEDTHFHKSFNLFCFSTVVDVIRFIMKHFYKICPQELLIQSPLCFLNVLLHKTITYIEVGLKKSSHFYTQSDQTAVSPSQN